MPSRIIVRRAVIMSSSFVVTSAFGEGALRVGEEIGVGAVSILVTSAGDHCQRSQVEESRSWFFSPRPQMTCETRTRLESIFKVTGMFFTGVGIPAMCTGVGTGVGITFASLGLAAQIAEFTLSNLPCDDATEEREIEQLGRRVVCEALLEKGIDCDPNTF